MRAQAKERGEPVPMRLPAKTPLFILPGDFIRVFDRDIAAAGFG